MLPIGLQRLVETSRQEIALSLRFFKPRHRRRDMACIRILIDRGIGFGICHNCPDRFMFGRGIFEIRTMLRTHLSPHRDRRLHGKLFLMDRFFWRQQNVSLARAKVQPEKQATSHQKRNSQYIVKHRKPIQPATMQNPFLSWRGYGSQSHWSGAGAAFATRPTGAVQRPDLRSFWRDCWHSLRLIVETGSCFRRARHHTQEDDDQ